MVRGKGAESLPGEGDLALKFHIRRSLSYHTLRG